MWPNLSLNPDASPAALRAVRSAPVSLVRWASDIERFAGPHTQEAKE
jgi:hypothetical protein